jgi:hypothetical protein
VAGNWYRYVYPGDGWKYWAMNSRAYSRILNRAKA